MLRGPSEFACGLVSLTAFLLAGCSSAPGQTRPNLQELADLLISDATMQQILELKARYELEVKGLAYLDKIATENLGPIRTELRVVGRFAKKLGIPVEPVIQLTAAQESQALQIIQDAESRWINKYGWMRLTPSDAENSYDNENPTLFTASFLWLVNRMGLLKGDLKQRWRDRLRTQVAAMQLQPGLYDRYPVTLRRAEVRPFSHDEQLGLDMLDRLFDYELGFAKDQFDYGLKHDFVFFNEGWSAPDQFTRPLVDGAGQPKSRTKQLAVAQRFGAFVEVLRRGAQQPPTFGGDLLICAGAMLTLQHNCDESSERLMAYFQASFFKDQTEELNGCFLQFKVLTEQKFKIGNVCGGRPVTHPNTFATLTEIYYHDENHPTRRLAHLVEF